MIKRGTVVRLILLLLIASVITVGCMPSAGTVDKGWTSFVVEGSNLYAVRATGDAVALDLENSGALRWEYAVAAAGRPGCGIVQKPVASAPVNDPLGAVYGVPAVSDDLFLLGSSESSLIALSTEDGQRLWNYPLDAAVVGGIAASEGVAYVGTVSGTVHAVDVATQKPVWAAPYATGDRVWSTPIVAGDVLYVASMDHMIHAIDRASGTQKWTADLGGAIQGDVLLYEGVLYAGGIDRRLHAINAVDGSELWVTEAAEAWVWGRPLVINGAVLFTTLDGKLHGHAAADGSTLWQAVTLAGGSSAAPVAFQDKALVATEGGQVYEVDPVAGTATEIYGATQAEQRGGYLSAPVVRDGVVYLGSTYGFIVALDPAARSPELWVYPSPSEEQPTK
ncbi:MAG: PQQ-binding-like beta-propeller repeat protein [Anaerolineae bacterium]